MGLYYIANKKTYRNLILIIFSLFFYAWGEPVWVCLLIGSSLLDYLNGLFIGKFKGRKIAVLGVVSSVVINLGVLAAFKYSGFIVENINMLAGTSFAVPQLNLPIGISFYTFQTISYTIDVYRGEVKPQRKFLDFLLFVSLFFQLVAGPIVRYKTIADEIDSRKVTLSEFSGGLTRFIYGLAKKVIIANCVGELATSSLGFSDKPNSVFSAWFGVIMFSLQIYYDFSGYSDMAIGLGSMFGFHFLENFNYPYISKSATEFWRRWHISLGTFFRDYVYIPMGGNRKRQILNLAVVWFLTGLWHGASWNFILWGCYFGALIVIEKLFLGKILEKIPAVFSHLYLIFVAIIGWAMFYFTDLNRFAGCVKAMFGAENVALIDELAKSQLLNNLYVIIIALILSAPVYKAIKNYTDKPKSEFAAAFYGFVRTLFSAVLLIISSVLLVGQTYNPFLYYRF